MISPLLSSCQQIKPDCIPRVDFHLHTDWTDGRNTVQEMHRRACDLGLAAVLFSEHGRASSGGWFYDFAGEVRALPEGPCRAYVGLETKIKDWDGNIDATPEMLDQCDLVMASVHRFPGEKGTVRGFGEIDPQEAARIEFELSCKALSNPAVDILGHPFGMSLHRFHVNPDERLVVELIERMADSSIAFEINSHYHAEPWKWIKWCQEAGTAISLGSNAHGVEEIGQVQRVLTGEEAA